MALQQATQGDGKSKTTGQGAGFDESQMELMEEEFGYDKAIPIAYLQWLGAWKKEKLISKGEFKPVDRLEEGQPVVRRRYRAVRVRVVARRPFERVAERPPRL